MGLFKRTFQIVIPLFFTCYYLFASDGDEKSLAQYFNSTLPEDFSEQSNVIICIPLELKLSKSFIKRMGSFLPSSFQVVNEDSIDLLDINNTEIRYVISFNINQVNMRHTVVNDLMHPASCIVNVYSCYVKDIVDDKVYELAAKASLNAKTALRQLLSSIKKDAKN